MLNSAKKEKVLKLRNMGYSYTQIMKNTGVSKSTLSNWLKNIVLPQGKIDKINKRVEIARNLGAKTTKEKRIHRTGIIKQGAILDIGKIDKNEFLHLGAMLYWGEGSKQSLKNISQVVEFVNSDPDMCRFFLKWITNAVGVSFDNLKFSIYINETKRNQSDDYLKQWSRIIDVPSNNIKIYFSRNKYDNVKKIGKDDYKGQLRIKVKKSTDLNRKITGWIEGIYINSMKSLYPS